MNMGKYTDSNGYVFRVSSECDLCGKMDQKVLVLDQVLDVCMPCLNKAFLAFQAFHGTHLGPLTSAVLDASEA